MEVQRRAVGVLRGSNHEKRRQVSQARKELEAAQAELRATTGPPLSDGTFAVKVVAVGASQSPSRIVLDLGRWFTGAAAHDAAAADGVAAHNDRGNHPRYFRNREAGWRIMPLALSATATFWRWGSLLGPSTIAIADFQQLVHSGAPWAVRGSEPPVLGHRAERHRHRVAAAALPVGHRPTTHRIVGALGGTGPVALRYSLGDQIRRHPRRDREHAARGHAPHVAEAGRSPVGQARGQQPHRLHQGPHRAEDGRGGRGVGRPHARTRRSWNPRPATRASRSAMVAARKGYRLTVVIPDNASQERIGLLRLFGAEIVFSDGDKGTNGSIEVAGALAADDQVLHAVPVREPGEPARALGRDRAGDHRGPARGDPLRRGHGHRGNAHRQRPPAARARPRHPGDRRRARARRPGLRAALARRGVRPADLRSGRRSTGSSW